MKAIARILIVALAFSTSPVYPQRTLAVASTGPAKPRVALIIGNAAYKESPLANPVNDATDVAKALESFGFKVILRQNAGTREMRQAIREFATQVRNADTGLFFYAGHGVQVNGGNFLIPVGADIQNEADVEDLAIDANYVLRAMEDAQPRVSIVILDACRNNPFVASTRSISRGLVQMSAATGSVIAFSTAPGSVAADGAGRNGIYTKYLLASLAQPDTNVYKVFQRARAGVVKETNGRQIPWESTSLLGDFSFKIEAPVDQVAVEAQMRKEKEEAIQRAVDERVRKMEEQQAVERAKLEETARRATADREKAERALAELRAAEADAMTRRIAEEKTAAQKAAEQAVAEQRAVQQQAAEKRATDEKLAAQKLAEQKLAQQIALEKRAAEAEAARRLAEEKLAAQRAAELAVAEKKAAEKGEAEEKLARQKLAEQKLADKKLADERAAAKRAAEDKLVADREAERKLAEQRVLEKKLAEQKAAEDRLAAQRAAEEKLAEQRLAEKRAAEQRAEEERLAAQRREVERKLTEQKAIEQKLADQREMERKAADAAADELRRAAQLAKEKRLADDQATQLATVQTGPGGTNPVQTPERAGVGKLSESDPNAAIPRVPVADTRVVAGVTIGDRWVYRISDGRLGRNLGTVTRVVSKQSPSDVIEGIEVRNPAGAILNTLDKRVSRDAKFFELRVQDLTVSEFAPYFKRFDALKDGKSWEDPYGLGMSNIFDWRLTAKVVGKEKVTVAAGSFDTIKISIQGNRQINQNIDPSFIDCTVWFAPAVNRIVKQSLTQVAVNNGRMTDIQTLELVEYRQEKQ